MNDKTSNRWNAARISYNYCSICGHSPNSNEDPNRTPIRFWDPDVGYRIGTLCRYCFHDVINDKPKPGDYAYDERYSMNEPETDEDPLLAF